MSAEKREALVSTVILEERLESLEEEIQAHRRFRPDADPFFSTTAWLIAEFRDAMREARIEFVTTATAAKMSGWAEQTLRRHAKRAIDGAAMEPGWEGLLVRQDAGEYAFCVASLPIKGEYRKAS